MASLIGREALTQRQAERLKRIDDEAGRLAGPTTRLPRASACVSDTPAPWWWWPSRTRWSASCCRRCSKTPGCAWAAARNGVEAFSFTLQHAPALLLLDMELPQSGGVAAARAVRTMVARPLPIVAMLSASAPMSAERALDADLDDVLDKPIAPESLYDKVLSWLEVPR